jgi:hypothetical protein
MALSITQTPAVVSLAQSPIIFTVAESTPVYTSSSFQYVGELYYWTGSMFNSSSLSDYTLVKFPNTATVGIFDLNRIINSTLTDLAQANSSNVKYFALDFYWQYLSGSSYVTGSHVKSDTYKALDGYGVFQEPIGQNISSASVHWPLMTSGPATQSAFLTNKGYSGVWGGDNGSAPVPTKIAYSASNGQTGNYNVSFSTTSSNQIQQYPIGPSQDDFAIVNQVGMEWFTVQAFNGSTPLGTPIKYDIVCEQKYPNVRIKWKNRFGQFDWMNFNMVSRQSFETERKTYQPQLGSWESSTFGYQKYDTATAAYIVDSKQGLSVNTNWLPESYNEILKQLLVSDEIYWIYEETDTGDMLRPLTIVTQNIVFKTGVVDKLIQYQFEFQLGQPYKLIM